MGPKWGEIEGLPSQKLFMSIFPNDFDQNLLNLKMSKMFTLLVEISRKIVFDTHKAHISFLKILLICLVKKKTLGILKKALMCLMGVKYSFSRNFK